ncbi:MAG TPA: protein-methionine-sulfoxide reductase heme-binding subunit MsrQ [Tepidisphaeraceae bacterium]|jgi:sulfoxide reductase heme-binding subunit YedZ|nr:protein-methionine-sulfoxide reductase heme-binding subunit MsrQ [Tepidisphaeraceae bacterium]
MKDPEFAKFALLVNGAVPLGLLGWDAYWGQLGADPVNHAIHVTGTMAIIFIALTLAVTPVRKISGWNWLSHFRRMLGLFAFFYACAHLLIYFVYDRQCSIHALVEDTLKRKFIFFGMAALVMMIPLAATSTNGMIKRLGAAKWKRLHRLVYLVAIAAAIHYWMGGSKIVGPKQEIFAAVVALLLGYRLVVWQLAEMRKARAAAPVENC